MGQGMSEKDAGALTRPDAIFLPAFSRKRGSRGRKGMSDSREQPETAAPKPLRRSDRPSRQPASARSAAERITAEFRAFAPAIRPSAASPARRTAAIASAGAPS